MTDICGVWGIVRHDSVDPNQKNVVLQYDETTNSPRIRPAYLT